MVLGCWAGGLCPLIHCCSPQSLPRCPTTDGGTRAQSPSPERGGFESRGLLPVAYVQVFIKESKLNKYATLQQAQRAWGREGGEGKRLTHLGPEEGGGGWPWSPVQWKLVTSENSGRGILLGRRGPGGRLVTVGTVGAILSLGLCRTLLHLHPVWPSANGPAAAGSRPALGLCAHRQQLERVCTPPEACCLLSVVSGTLGGLPLLRPPCRGGEGGDIVLPLLMPLRGTPATLSSPLQF